MFRSMGARQARKDDLVDIAIALGSARARETLDRESVDALRRWIESVLAKRCEACRATAGSWAGAGAGTAARTFCVHGARSTQVVPYQSDRQRARRTHGVATLEGWAYATERSGPGVRVVTDVSGPSRVVLGATHMDLEIYNVQDASSVEVLR